MIDVSPEFLTAQARTNIAPLKEVKMILPTKEEVDITDRLVSNGDITKELEQQLNASKSDDVTLTLKNHDGYFSNENGTGILDVYDDVIIKIYKGIQGIADRLLRFSGIIQEDMTGNKGRPHIVITCFGWEKDCEKYNAEGIGDPNGNPLKHITGLDIDPVAYNGQVGVRSLKFGYVDNAGNDTIQFADGAEVKLTLVYQNIYNKREIQYIRAKATSFAALPDEDQEDELVIVNDSGTLRVGYFWEFIKLSDLVSKTFDYIGATNQDINVRPISTSNGQRIFNYLNSLNETPKVYSCVIWSADENDIVAIIGVGMKLYNLHISLKTMVADWKLLDTLTGTKNIIRIDRILKEVSGQQVGGLFVHQGTVDTYFTYKFTYYTYDAVNFTVSKEWDMLLSSVGSDWHYALMGSFFYAFTDSFQKIYYAVRGGSDLGNNYVRIYSLLLSNGNQTQVYYDEAPPPEPVYWESPGVGYVNIVNGNYYYIAWQHWHNGVDGVKWVRVKCVDDSVETIVDTVKNAAYIRITNGRMTADIVQDSNPQKGAFSSIIAENKLDPGNLFLYSLYDTYWPSNPISNPMKAIFAPQLDKKQGADYINYMMNKPSLGGYSGRQGQSQLTGWKGQQIYNAVSNYPGSVDPDVEVCENEIDAGYYHLSAPQAFDYEGRECFLCIVNTSALDQVVPVLYIPSQVGYIEKANTKGYKVNQFLNELAKPFLCLWKRPDKDTGIFYYRDYWRGEMNVVATRYKHKLDKQRWKFFFDGVLITDEETGKEWYAGDIGFGKRVLPFSTRYVSDSYGNMLAEWNLTFFNRKRGLWPAKTDYLIQVEPFDKINLTLIDKAGNTERIVETFVYKVIDHEHTDKVELFLLEKEGEPYRKHKLVRNLYIE